MTIELDNPTFTSEDAARQALEAVRWPNGPICPHCGSTGDDVALVAGKGHRPGLYYCNGCEGQFTVTVGTVFERSKIKLHKWWLAVYLLNSSKKGFSAHQLHRTLKVTYKTAWFMMHRIREAMREGTLSPMGGGGKVVEIDETVIGRVAGAPKKPKQGYHTSWRNVVLTLVERGGNARSFHIDGATMASLLPVIRVNVNRESTLMTDEWKAYQKLGEEFAAHEAVNHSKEEYVRGSVTTNTVEGYFSIFKRGMKGIYQHCSEKHLHRYLAEFDFRYSHRVRLGYSDGERAVLAMKGISGKRLTYRPTRQQINEARGT